MLSSHSSSLAVIIKKMRNLVTLSLILFSLCIFVFTYKELPFFSYLFLVAGVVSLCIYYILRRKLKNSSTSLQTEKLGEKKSKKSIFVCEMAVDQSGSQEGCCDNIGPRARELLDKVPPCTCEFSERAVFRELFHIDIYLFLSEG